MHPSMHMQINKRTCVGCELKVNWVQNQYGVPKITKIEITRRFLSKMELNTWVSDKLHDILGFSDKHTVEYLVSLSKSTKTSDTFREKLQGFLGPLDGEVLNFANDLWQRVPHQQVFF